MHNLSIIKLRGRKAALRAGVALLISAAVSPAFAQGQAATTAAAEPAEEGETIVVTALKRAENVQNIPAAVSVVSSTALAQAGATKLEDVTKLSPSISFTPAGGNIHSTISMRGVFSNNLSPGIPSAVGVVIDDVPQPPEAQGFNELADIERIEILRGPQATVSGRNAAAGLVNIVTSAPSRKEFVGKVNATVTTDSEYRLQSYLSGPLGETLAASVTGYYNKFNGVAQNITLNKKLGRESYGARAKLLWQPTENFEATLVGFIQKLRDENAAPIYQSFAPAAARNGINYLTAVGNFDYRIAQNRFTASSVDGFQDSDSKAASLRMVLGLGDYDLVSITGYQYETTRTRQDVYGVIKAVNDLQSAGQFDGSQNSVLVSETKSQELRLVSPANRPFSYVLGAFYLDSTASYDFLRSSPGHPANFNRIRSSRIKNYAAYARLNFDVSDQFKLGGGLRWNREEISYSLFDRIANAGTTNRDSDNVLLGDLTATYQFSPDANLYARYARGYQGKAYDLDAAFTVGVPYTAIAPEQVDAFEVGFKSQFLDRRLTLNIAAFNTTYSNYQAQSRDAINPLLFTLLSVGKVRTRGVEIDTMAKVGDNLRLEFSGAYIDAKFLDWADAPCYAGQTAATGCVTNGARTTQNLVGRQLSNSPDLRFNAAAEYRLPIESLPFDISLRGDVTWQNDVNFDITLNPLTVQKSYAIANLSAVIADKENKYRVTLFVNNVANQHYVTQLSDGRGFFGGNAAISTRYLPRDWQRYGGIRVSYNF